MQIHVAKGDLVTMPVDGVVNPANSQGLMLSGVAGALKAAGGPEIEEEARAFAPIAVGAALVTTAGSLPARHVIHAPTMEEPGMKIGVENVRRAMRAALIAAARNNLQTIAVPGMGTGIGGVPVDEASRAIVDELRAHRQPMPQTVYLVATSEIVIQAFEAALKNAILPG